MDGNVRILLGLLSALCIIGAIISVVFMIYYFFAMHAGVREERRNILPFLGPFQLFIPQLWDERGNRARVRLIICILLFGAFFGATALIFHLGSMPN